MNIHNIPSLETLNMIQNKINIMPQLSENIQKVNLDSNFIKIFDKSSKTIKTLSISLNYVEKIEDSLKMEELEILDFSMNRIASIDNFSMKFPSIKYVNFSLNLMKQIPNHLSDTIVELDLSGNKKKLFQGPFKISQI